MQSYPQSELSWSALYDDGSVYYQSDTFSTEQLDRDKLQEFRVYDHQSRLIFVVKLNPKRRLIFRARKYMNSSGDILGTIYMTGWHSKVGKGTVKVIAYIYPDGHIELDDSRNDLQLVASEEFEK